MTEYMTGYGTAIRDAVRVMPDGRKVTAIPARVQRYATEHMIQTNRPRVAAYARVSTDQEEQETSFEAQCDYYSRLIRGNPAWEYAGLYTDDGVSATSTARREGFNRLIADALDGKIDRIITKSVSRFARNTVDSLTTIRRLKEKGVGVTFEKENIDTLDSKGELMITIMSSLAQEESRSISENVTWGWRKRIADGKVSMTYGKFLGYERGADGDPVIDEAQAQIVRQIYWDVSGWTNPVEHCGHADAVGHPHAHRQGKLAEQHGQIHPDQRKIQGRCAAAEDDYGGFFE